MRFVEDQRAVPDTSKEPLVGLPSVWPPSIRPASGQFVPSSLLRSSHRRGRVLRGHSCGGPAPRPDPERPAPRPGGRPPHPIRTARRSGRSFSQAPRLTATASIRSTPSCLRSTPRSVATDSTFDPGWSRIPPVSTSFAGLQATTTTHMLRPGWQRRSPLPTPRGTGRQGCRSSSGSPRDRPAPPRGNPPPSFPVRPPPCRAPSAHRSSDEVRGKTRWLKMYGSAGVGV